MEVRNVKVRVIKASGLKNGAAACTHAEAWLEANAAPVEQKQRTLPDEDDPEEPLWGENLHFSVDDAALRRSRSCFLLLAVIADETRTLGTADVPLHSLFADATAAGAGKPETQTRQFQLLAASGAAAGNISLSVEFADSTTSADPPALDPLSVSRGTSSPQPTSYSSSPSPNVGPGISARSRYSSSQSPEASPATRRPQPQLSSYPPSTPARNSGSSRRGCRTQPQQNSYLSSSSPDASPVARLGAGRVRQQQPAGRPADESYSSSPSPDRSWRPSGSGSFQQNGGGRYQNKAAPSGDSYSRHKSKSLDAQYQNNRQDDPAHNDPRDNTYDDGYAYGDDQYDNGGGDYYNNDYDDPDGDNGNDYNNDYGGDYGDDYNNDCNDPDGDYGNEYNNDYGNYDDGGDNGDGNVGGVGGGINSLCMNKAGSAGRGQAGGHGRGPGCGSGKAGGRGLFGGSGQYGWSGTGRGSRSSAAATGASVLHMASTALNVISKVTNIADALTSNDNNN